MSIKAFIQRGQRGWADEDTQNLDRYLARVISESVNHLSKQPDYAELAPEEWRNMLRLISKPLGLDSWRDMKDGENAKDWIRRCEAETENRKKALHLLAEYFDRLWH